MRRLATLALILLASPAAAAPAPVWIVDKARSEVRFSSRFNGEAFSGAFGRFDAAIRFDPKNLAGSSVRAEIDAGSAKTGDKDRDAALPGADFLAAGRFPEAIYEAHAFKALGGGRYLAQGTLSLRGVAKPLAVPFTLAIAGRTARMKASLTLNRLAFGVGQGEWRSTSALPADVAVTIDLTAQRR